MPSNPEDKSELEKLSDETRMMELELTDADPGPMGRLNVDPLPKDAHPELEITTGKKRGRTFAIKKSLVMLGRLPDVVDIVIPDDAASRHHAAIGYKGGAFMLFDLGSSNGTFVNGKRVTECRLEHGSEIGVGETVLTFWVS